MFPLDETLPALRSSSFKGETRLHSPNGLDTLMDLIQACHEVERENVIGDELSAEEGFRVFEAASKRYLKMSASEFLSKWKCGFFATADADTQRRASDVALLLPLVESC